MGLGRDFESLRDYQPGDERRDICWTVRARRGKPVTSCVVVEAEPVVKLPSLTARQMTALRVLREEIASRGQVGQFGVPHGTACVTVDEWRQAFYSRVMPGEKQDTRLKAFKRVMDSLVADAAVHANDPFVWPGSASG